MDYAKDKRWMLRQCVVVVTLCLVGLVAVHSAKANWRVNGTNITVNQTVVSTKHTALSFLIPSLNLEIVCNGHESEGLVLIPGSGGTASGNIKLSECITKIKGIEQKGCPPLGQPIVSRGKGHLILSVGRNYLLIEPEAGQPFAIVKFNEETCTLPPENKITGSFVLECVALSGGVLVEKDCATEEVTHIMRHAESFKDSFFFGANPATYTGSVSINLTGANAGKPWSGTV